MSKYVESNGCTCDTPTGSESRRCSYCRSVGYQPKEKRRNNSKKPRKVKVQKIPLRKDEPTGTMTVAMAWERSRKKMEVRVGNNWHNFAYVGWLSPSTEEVTGPILVTIDGVIAIEISNEGQFLDAYPATAGCYFPWVKVGIDK